MIMYDSLRRDMLPMYGEDGVDLPNFKRLAEHTVTFDRSYVGSLPCMPARRELHTGRLNFMHRSWGPLEPFDDSMPEILKHAGIHSHLATDHYHYIQDGGATYHGRYSTWACYRGQESDAWIGDCTPHGGEMAPQVSCNSNTVEPIRQIRKKAGWQNLANRARRQSVADYSQVQTVEDGLDFIRRNVAFDNWFLQVEMFDPHEPFDSPEEIQRKWFDPDMPGARDWPSYTKVSREEDDVESMRKKYKALLEFCDQSLGRMLDAMDELDLWKDTLLIVNTDHGFFLGEHEWWGKGMMPDYEELTHTPLFVWDPVSQGKGIHSDALVQTIDLAPTVLDYFGLKIPGNMTGLSLLGHLREGKEMHSYAVFGYHGGPMNITDGHYVYMRAVREGAEGLFEYTLMPTHMNERFQVEELERATLHPEMAFTKGCPLLKIPCVSYMGKMKLDRDLLYDLEEDPMQNHPIMDENVETRMIAALKEELECNEAPEELYAYYGLE